MSSKKAIQLQGADDVTQKIKVALLLTVNDLAVCNFRSL